MQSFIRPFHKINFIWGEFNLLMFAVFLSVRFLLSLQSKWIQQLTPFSSSLLWPLFQNQVCRHSVNWGYHRPDRQSQQNCVSVSCPSPPTPFLGPGFNVTLTSSQSAGQVQCSSFPFTQSPWLQPTHHSHVTAHLLRYHNHSQPMSRANILRPTIIQKINCPRTTRTGNGSE